MIFVDSHCHIDGPEYDSDRKEVIARANQASNMLASARWSIITLPWGYVMLGARNLASVITAVAGGLTGSINRVLPQDQPPATAGGSD